MSYWYAQNFRTWKRGQIKNSKMELGFRQYKVGRQKKNGLPLYYHKNRSRDVIILYHRSGSMNHEKIPSQKSIKWNKSQKDITLRQCVDIFHFVYRNDPRILMCTILDHHITISRIHIENSGIISFQKNTFIK